MHCQLKQNFDGEPLLMVGEVVCMGHVIEHAALDDIDEGLNLRKQGALTKE